MPTIFARYSKAVGGFLGIVLPLGGAVLSLGVLSGPLSHDLAVTLAALTPIAGTLGVVVAPANQAALDKTTADAVLALRAEYEAIVDAVSAPLPGAPITD